MLLQSSPLLSSVSRMEFKDVKCFTTAWSLGRFALAQGEKGRCGTSAFHKNHSSVAVSIFFSYRTWRDARESNKVETTMPESAEQAAALLRHIPGHPTLSTPGCGQGREPCNEPPQQSPFCRVRLRVVGFLTGALLVILWALY